MSLFKRLKQKTNVDPYHLLDKKPLAPKAAASEGSDIVSGTDTVLIGNRQISKRTLIIIAAVFAVLGAYLMFRSFAATSVTTVNNSTIGTNTNQFQFEPLAAWTAGADGPAYGSDEHYSNVVGAYYQVKFSGTQAKIYTTKDIKHGIAKISIDGVFKEEVDTYANPRTHGALMYASPVLPEGPHTIKVEVTGRKNAAATDSYIIADRVEITSSEPATSPPSPNTTCSPVPFPSRLKAVGRTIVDENGCVMPKLKGFNMHALPCSGQLCTPEQEYKDIYAAGGRVLRTVVHWDRYESTKDTIDQTMLQMLDTHIARAAADHDPITPGVQGIYVMVELHLNTGNLPAWVKSGSGNDETEKYALYGQTITQTLAQRYGGNKAVLGFNLNEPPIDNTTMSGNDAIPTLEAQQRQMIKWFRSAGAPDWIGFVSLAYANQKPQLDGDRKDANPDAYDYIGEGIPGGNVVFDAHDYLVYNDSTDPNTDSRWDNGGVHDTRYPPGAHWLSINDPHSFPTDSTKAGIAKSQMKAFLKPFDTYATAAQMPLMVGEFGWNQTGNTTKGAYYAAKREAMNSVNTAIEIHWMYGINQTQDPWVARPGGVWDADVLNWLKEPSSGTTADITNPTTSWLKPAEGATVSGYMFEATNSGSSGPCEVSASDNVGVTKVKFYAGSTLLNEELTAPYNCKFDTAQFADGNYTLKAEAYDAAGNTTAATRSVTVKNSTTPITSTGWELLYQDDFNTLNTSSTTPHSWGFYSGPGHGGNGLRRPEAFSIITDPTNGTNKLLQIRAENYVDPADGVTKIRSGGMANRTNIAYGKYEVRVKTEVDPTGTMSGLALTWPQKRTVNSVTKEHWPGDGELDWYETTTNPLDRSYFHSYQHWPCFEGACGNGSWVEGGPRVSPDQTHFKHNFNAAQWHTVTMEWTPTSIKMFTDGQQVYHDSCATTGTTNLCVNGMTNPAHIPDVAHHVSLQLDAMANRLLSQPVHQYVDYVKVYKMSSTTTPDAPPTISITNPANNAPVAGTITVTASASDDKGTVAGVQFKVDGQNVGTEDQISPYTYPLNTASLPNGNHTISAVARDSANQTTTATITVSVQNADTTAPNPPSSLCGTTTQPTNTAAGKVVLAWPAATDNGNPASGIKHYLVQRNGTTITTVSAAAAATCNDTSYQFSYTDNNVPTGTYSYVIRSVDNALITSTTASPAYGTTINPAPGDTSPPSAPIVSAVTISSSQINLSWTTSTDNVSLAGYNVYRGTSPTSITTKLNSSLITTTSLTDATGLNANTTYYYQVEAVDGAGNPARSSSVSATTSPNTAQIAALSLYTGPAGVAAHDNFSAWLGNEAIYALDFADDSQPWENIANYSDWFMDPWANWTKANPARQLVVSLPMLNQASSGQLSQGASGAYDQYFRTFGQELMDKGLGNSIIRLGWEANGDWYPWKASTDPTAWKSYYRRIVNVMRSVPGQNFKFDLTYNRGTSGTPIKFETIYPGNDVVDIIGLDTYDIKWNDNVSSPDVRWNDMLTQEMGLNEFKAFAASKSKPMSLPEWGLWPTGTIDGGGGDNPYYIDRMADWIKANKDQIAYQSYFNHLSGGADGDHRLSSYPNSEARFKAQFGTTVVDIVKPTAPVLTTLPGDGKMFLRWTAATDNVGVTRYEVWKTDATGDKYVIGLPATANSYTVTGLTNGVTYSFRVVAYDAANNYMNSNIVADKPTAPTDTPPTVSITNPANNAPIAGTITVAASASDNNSVRGVQFKVDGQNVGTEDQIAPYTYPLNTASLPNGNHTISAVAYDSANQSATATITVSVQNTEAPRPPAPTNFTAVAASSTQVNLAWSSTAINGVDGGTSTEDIIKYNILRKLSSQADSAYVVIASVNVPAITYTDNTAIASTNYTYTIQSVNSSGTTSANAVPASVTTPAAPDSTSPSAPSTVSATAVSQSQINLTWSVSTDTGGSGLAGYNVYRGTSPTSITTKLNSSLITTTSLTDATGLSANTTYYYQVEAVDGAGNKSTKSSTVSATTTISDMPALEAEKMSLPAGGEIKDDSLASESKFLRFYRNGISTGQFTLTSPANEIVIRAKGIQCNGTPQMIVRINNVQVLNTPVSSTSWRDYVVATNIPGGSHTVSIEFPNDYSQYTGNSGKMKCSRDLDIDNIVFRQ